MGLYLLSVAAVWIGFAGFLSRWVTSRIRFTVAKWTLALAVFAVLLPLPLVDEIAGKRQFERLCAENAEIRIDRAAAVGKTVKYVPQPQVDVAGAYVRIVLRPQRFVDAHTREVVFSYNELLASGGQFVHFFRVSEGKVPLLFRGSCGPKENPRDLVKTLQITVLDH